MPRELDNISNAVADAASNNVVQVTTNSYLNQQPQTVIITTSSAAINVYLPAANGVIGLIINLSKTNTDLTYVTNVWPSGSETIGGRTQIRLWTANETFRLVSNGVNWTIVNHFARTEWTSGGTPTFTSTSSSPTKATTKLYDSIFWHRDGKDLYVNYLYYHNNNAGALDGSGDYLCAIPYASTLTIDQDYILNYTTVEGNGQWANYGNTLGNCTINAQSSNAIGTAVVYDSTRFRVMYHSSLVTSGGCWGPTNYGFTVFTLGFTAYLRIPINEFDP